MCAFQLNIALKGNKTQQLKQAWQPQGGGRDWSSEELQPYFQKITTYLEGRLHLHVVFILPDAELGVKAFFLGPVVERYQRKLIMIS